MKNVTKYLLLSLLSFLSFSTITYAAQNSMNGSGFTSNVYMPTQMDFYDLTSVNTGIKKNNTVCYGDYCSVDSMAVGPTQWGAAVTFDTNTLFKDGFLYSINVYLGYMSTDGNCYDWAYFNNYTPRLTIATDISATYERFNQNIASNIISYAHSYGSFKIRPNDSTGNNFCSGRMSFLFVPQTGGNSVFVPFLSTYTHYDWVFYGYEVQGYGQYSTLSQSDISGIQSSLQSSINDSTTAINNNINSSTTDIKQNMEQFTNSINNTIIQKENETQDKLDDIKDMDINDEDKELPNQDSFDDYQDGEKQLLDSVKQADLNNLSIGIDSTTSGFVWTTLTDLIQSHPLIFSMFIAILSIGIIKLALGR